MLYQREHLDLPSSSAHPTRNSIEADHIPSQVKASKAVGSNYIRQVATGNRKVEESCRIEEDDSHDVREKPMTIASNRENKLGKHMSH